MGCVAVGGGDRGSRFPYDDNVAGKGGRPRSETPARPRSFWLTDELMAAIDERAEADGVSRSELVRQALAARLTSPPIHHAT